MITSWLFVDSGHCKQASVYIVQELTPVAQFIGSTGKCKSTYKCKADVCVCVWMCICTGRSWSSTTVCSKRLRWHISVPHADEQYAPVHISNAHGHCTSKNRRVSLKVAQLRGRIVPLC